jgi:hypothetical protein
MNAIIEYTQFAKQFYEKTVKEIKMFKSKYEGEMAFATLMTINGAFVCVLLGVAFTIVHSFARISWFVAAFIWKSLTPGQQWLELASIATSIITFAFIANIANDFEKSMDAAFTKLKKEIADKTAIISEQDEKITKLEAIIAEKNEENKVV